MEKPSAAATGRAEIESVFFLFGHGLVLVLKDGFTGIIHGPGVVQGMHGASSFTGLEFIDGRDISGAQRNSVCVVAKALNATELFQPGDEVCFFQEP